jgi:hypothetical protein
VSDQVRGAANPFAAFLALSSGARVNTCSTVHRATHASVCELNWPSARINLAQFVSPSGKENGSGLNHFSLRRRQKRSCSDAEGSPDKWVSVVSMNCSTNRVEPSTIRFAIAFIG